MSVSFLFAILNISDFSIALALVLGLATTIISSGGVYIITLVKLIFSGRNINETEIQNKKQTIMVKLKKIILEIADDKDAFFVGMFLIAISLSVAYFVFVFMLIDKNNCSVPIANFGLFQYANYINLGIAIIWLTFSVVVITTYLIIALKVTSFKNSPRRIIILHHKDKYKAELYSQPFWGKCEYNVINIPDNWERVIREGGLKSFKFPFEISINKQLINGLGTETIISFPITIVFYFSGPLGIHDLEKISGDGDKKVIYIDDYILNYFFKVNSDKNILKKIKDAAMIWEDGKISLVGLSRIAEKNIKFSEHIFSNIRKTELHVEISNSRVMEIFEPNLNKKE